MKNQSRTLIGAAEYCLQTISSLKKGMMDIGSPNQKVALSIGGIIVTMTSNLLIISQEVIQESAKSQSPNAIDDLKLIQSKFNDFINQMINGNK